MTRAAAPTPAQEHTPSWYAATRVHQRTWPRLEGQIQCQIAIIGGGFTGINTAIELAQEGYQVTLLEAHRLGWGASGRNGGELIRGIGHHLDQFQPSLGDEGVKRLKQLGLEAVDLVKKRIQAHQIPCDLHLGYADLATCSRHIEDLETEQQEMADLGYPHAMRLVRGAEVREQVVDSAFYPAALIDEGSGHLHPLNLLLGEADLAEQLGVTLFEQSQVLRIEKGDKPKLFTAQGQLECDLLVIAANGYLDAELEPWLGSRILPAGSYLIASSPLPEALCQQLMPGRKAVADMRTALDYYRISADHRLIFGGLCTYSGRDPKDIAAALRPHIRQVFPQLQDLTIEYQWGGMLGIGANRLPQIGRLPDAPNIYYAQAYAGHGLNATHLAARTLAQAIRGDETDFALFAKIEHLRFPGGRYLRAPLLAGGMLWYQLIDRLRSL
ncbi:NAD(P)/FAD-dependent oxidoreductase [Nitrincola tapanii]|uniref:FAD-binding oxidoreductase n=1 Tax=Nitrincola tapanii TaxID=1708751 RepID=A0A5A9W074_9GAMM|nr:FAD-binding oxidoreductase [Nitrincola tapanii]KAA0873619.1 FAD-binding oxidoreductase [Nitrincola tapanii]